MTHPQPNFAVLAVGTYPSTPKCGARAIITGFGLLHITKLSAGDFRFEIHTEVDRTLSDEPQLLTKLADTLPHPTFWIGDQIDARILTPLQNADDRHPAVIAAHLRQRLAGLESAIMVDIAAPAKLQMCLCQADIARPASRIVIGTIGNAIVDEDATRAILNNASLMTGCAFCFLTLWQSGDLLSDSRRSLH
jgi:hypothetical protein